MDFYAFNCLPREQRAELVWQQGRFQAIRLEMGCSVLPYHLGGSFAEACYSPEDLQIIIVPGVYNRKHLELYLESCWNKAKTG